MATTGGKPINGAAMSGAERTRRYRTWLRAGPTDVISRPTDLLMLDAETIAAPIFTRRRPIQSPGL
jgi:hypothetical protein